MKITHTSRTDYKLEAIKCTLEIQENAKILHDVVCVHIQQLLHAVCVIDGSGMINKPVTVVQPD